MVGLSVSHSKGPLAQRRDTCQYLVCKMKQRTLADPSERGLVMTHSELVLVFPSAGVSMNGFGLSLPFEAGVT